VIASPQGTEEQKQSPALGRDEESSSETEMIDVDDDTGMEDTNKEMTDKFIGFMNEFWNEYDDDGNGELDKTEFKFFLKDCYQQEEDDDEIIFAKKIDEKFDEMFDEFDKDKNGVITKDEMFEFLTGMFGMDASQIDYERVAKRKD